MIARVGPALLFVTLAALVLPNARSLYEGIFFYLRDALAYNPTAVRSIRRDGQYASVYDLIHLRNADRRDYLLQHLDFSDVSVTLVPISNSPFSDLFIRFNPQGPYTIFSAHYDKLHDDPNYQGASDNTAAVSVLLASITELARRHYRGSAAFLFTGEEETGWRGAAAFVEYTRANNLVIRDVVNFDNLGRGKLAIRPSAETPGLVFTILLFGDVTYDGREFRLSQPYPPANARLTHALLRAQPNITVYERFTARSDSNVFEASGMDTVAISGDDMRYLELTWHTYADRIELLDERNLDLAFELIMHYAAQ